MNAAKPKTESIADPATILVIEDDASLNAALAATLKAAGFRPVTARTAAEGLRWFNHYAPDLVLLDLGLPDRDGLTVIADIRGRGQTPIVVLSARDAEAMKVAALDLGADDYVQKPFGVEELLAAVGGAYNAVFVEARSAGRLMFYGAGAGGTPTAAAVLGDIVAVARNRLAGTRGPELSTHADLPVLPMGDTLTRYHVSLDVADKPGVLAPVAEAFARHGVSIQAVRQTSRGEDALLIIVTHEARDADLAATISELQALPVVRAVASVMRVEGEEDQ